MGWKMIKYTYLIVLCVPNTTKILVVSGGSGSGSDGLGESFVGESW